ncbi:Omp28-related outer membrane protein, partial [Flavobacteriales bacterium]|nr:Omp28-related outer membrane protein [Flavobacteriales bacterium]
MKTTTMKFGKYLMLSFLALGITVSSCKKDEDGEDSEFAINATAHSQKQVPIVYKSTGETCYYCGDWGWQAWIDLSNAFEGTALTWANYSTGFSNAHFRGQELNSSNSTMEAIKQNFGSGGKPNWYVNGNSLGTSSSAANSAAAASIASASSAVVASASIEGTLEDGVLTVDAQAKFYSAASGEYYMGAYVIENNVNGPQAGPIGASGNVDHHLVMRGSMTSASAWGEQIVSSSASAGSEFEKTFTVTIPASYNEDNINVGIIIW